ncbi:MAG: 1-acyl-sn-glycerol-3-phosphate acyltransferase [candidate division NC10 bacterium]|nr:1-acyl-sn-glycerol-3-phosphate acyltransferase [candidate division NC10 bacterium]MBI4412888.1 1-acyl-sn-glycerol-3-phosphate acyltransferase [candidate division NC10 bacterium]
MARLTGTDFRPARPSRPLIAFAALLNRVILPRHTTLDVRPADLALLRSLPPGCLIAPNHAHYADPQVTFELARRAGRRFIYMATREAFDGWGGWQGWIIQRLGVFSVNRGGANVEAQRFARGVLVAGEYDLLMFPEGEIYLLNDLVMPLKPGVARLALEAADECIRQGRPRRVPIVPVAVKYEFREDITPALEATAARLEAALLGRPRVGPLYSRIVALGTELLARAERAYGVTPAPGEGLFERVRRLRRSLLERLEKKHLGQVREAFDFDRARRLMIRIQGRLLAAGGGSGYYGPPAALPGDPLAADLEAARLCARSVAFQDDYLLQDPTPERMAETLIKLEREALGREIRASLGRRRAVIRIAPPLDVREFLAGERAGSSCEDTIEAIVIRLHEALQGALDAIARETPERAGGAGG